MSKVTLHAPMSAETARYALSVAKNILKEKTVLNDPNRIAEAAATLKQTQARQAPYKEDLKERSIIPGPQMAQVLHISKQVFGEQPSSSPSLLNRVTTQ